MAAGGAHFVRLPQRQHAGRIRPRFELRFRAIGPGAFDDEVGPAAAEKAARIASARPEPIVRRAGHLADFRDQLVAFDVRIEHIRGANLEHEIATGLDGIDRDDLRRARDARALHGTQAERPAADDGRCAAGGDGRERLRHRRAEAGDADAAADHRKLDCVRFREDRDDPLFKRHHQLGEAADVRVGIHRRAVAHVGDRHEVVWPLPSEELAHVGAAAQALIAGTALRRPGDADAITDLNAADFRSHRFDDTDAAVAIDERHPRHRSREHPGQAEHGRGIRVAEVRRFGPHDDLPSADRTQRQLLQRRPPRAGAARDPSAKCPSRRHVC